MSKLNSQWKLNSNGISRNFQCFLVTVLLSVFALVAVVQAQEETGFINMDCGISETATYSDKSTGLVYVSDAGFIDTGKSMNIAVEYSTYNIDQQLQTVRSFPEGERNCYKIGTKKGNKYLIRAVFAYLNYDGLRKAPQFDLYVGPNKWETLDSFNSTTITTKEIIHFVNSSYIDICLVNIGSGTPFISTLELRPLKVSMYDTTFGSLSRFARFDVASSTNKLLRYADDSFDRIWAPYQFLGGLPINTSEAVDATGQNHFQPPPIVMSTAAIPADPDKPLSVTITDDDSSFRFLIYMHFAEVVRLEANQTRIFNISLNGEHWYGPFSPNYLSTTTVYSRSPTSPGNSAFSLYKTGNSTLPPLLNAIEIFNILDISSQQPSNEDDVDAITNIKSAYGIKRNWQGDPCSPRAYMWDGLNCSHRNDDIPRITSLNLSSSGLTGEIPSYISSLTLLESLDLSSNDFIGLVPDFLTQLPALKVLNLMGNNLSGSVPSSLMERANKHLLYMSVDGNPNLCPKSSCNSEKKSIVVPVVASIAGAVVVIFVVAVLFYFHKKRRQASPVVVVDTKASNIYEAMESKGRHFTYSQLSNMTNNFENVLGKGGFGTVYLGYLEGTKVAVKMLSVSEHSYKQFEAEVNLLLRVHHRNLTSLVGYCDESNKMGLVYEFMANGDLEQLCSDAGSNRHLLKWEKRLDIVVEAAKGLEYLHNGCKPPIVHRDIKAANILLNDKFQAKLADFGLSRSFPVEGGTHVSTVVAGTPGYLDPEYFVTNRLAETSDVYSFGVVLLKLISGRPVNAMIEGKRIHISAWVNSLLANGDIRAVIDPCLGGDYNINSIWKAVEIAMACASPTSAGRPTMDQVVIELSECLAMEQAQKKHRNDSESEYSNATMSESTILAR